MKPLPLLLVAAVLLAGCQAPNLVEPADPLGKEAFALMEALVYDGEGLRPRAPESPGREGTIAFLQDQAAPGWDVTLERFTGQEYLDLDHRITAQYDGCPQEDQDAVADLAFTNIYYDWNVGGGPTLWLAAHWDAKEHAKDGGPMPAANDGASGVGLLLAMQARIVDLDLPFGVRIALFDGEDGFEDCHPLAGSIIAASRIDDPEAHRLILLDMVGDPEAKFLYETQSVRSDPGAMQSLWANAAFYGLEENLGRSRSMVDDHIPFVDIGMRAIDIIDGGRETVFPPYWHTQQDTPDNLDPEMLAKVGHWVLGLMESRSYQAGFDSR